MATWQERMARHAEISLRPVMEGFAEGVCTDEGELPSDWSGLHPVLEREAQERPARVEYSKDAALWLFENPPPEIPEPYRSVLKALAVHPSPVVRDAVAKAFAYKSSDPNIVEVRPIPSRELSTAEFMGRFHSDVAEMMRYEGMTRKDAETEFTWRYAEEQTGVSRPSNPWQEGNFEKLRKAQDAAYQRVYRNT